MRKHLFLLPILIFSSLKGINYELLKDERYTDYEIRSNIDDGAFECHKLSMEKNEFFNKAINGGNIEYISLDFSSVSIEAMLAGIYEENKIFKNLLNKMNVIELMDLTGLLKHIKEKNLQKKVEKRILKIEVVFLFKEQIENYFKYLSSQSLIELAKKVILSDKKYTMILAEFISLNVNNKKSLKILNYLRNITFKYSQEFFDIILNNINEHQNSFYVFKNLTFCEVKIESITISPQGSRLVIQEETECCAKERPCYLYALNKGKYAVLLKKFAKSSPLCFSPDGKKFVYALNCELICRESKRGKLVKKIDKPVFFKISSFFFHLNKSYFLIKLNTGVIKMFDSTTLNEIKFSEDMINEIYSENKVILNIKDDNIDVFDLIQNKKICVLPNNMEKIISLDLNYRGNLLAIAHSDRKIIVFRIY